MKDYINGALVDTPTEEQIRLLEIQTAETKLYTDNKYKFDRQWAYPSIGDQLDMIWQAMDAGTLPSNNSFYTSIKAVKDAFPKPK